MNTVVVEQWHFAGAAAASTAFSLGSSPRQPQGEKTTHDARDTEAIRYFYEKRNEITRGKLVRSVKNA